ncbi:CoA ester lyase [Microbacterium sp. ISL-103]|uniref:HpcH/HpaI aldolase/citrate lyase family protein n=1 Tax=Microbacterium sp. ISL-103 TaxID=2819156 RepID=UPI002034E95C|nr:aldolase/citrate lyase family protein [Microbacterium sp. ISL-103]
MASNIVTHATVGTDIARSWLLVAAHSEEDLRAGVTSDADQVVIDLEDGVPQALKAHARDHARRVLTAGAQAWVRINSVETDEWRKDLDALRGAPGVRGLVVAKAESARDVDAVVSASELPVIALVESALGIARALEIATADGVVRLAFGSGDYRRDTGASDSELAMSFPRSSLVVASRAAKLPGPIDGPTVGRDREIMFSQSRAALDLGMTGRLCLSVHQAAAFNDLARPSTSDDVWARTFLQEFQRRGGAVRDGSELPRIHRAQSIQRLVAAFGVRD